MRHLTHRATAVMILVLIATATPASAKAPNCKALSKAACQREPACVWVDPYKRMDEVKVAGFCRAAEPPEEAEDD